MNDSAKSQNHLKTTQKSRMTQEKNSNDLKTGRLKPNKALQKFGITYKKCQATV